MSTKRETVFVPTLENATVADAMHAGIVSCSADATPVEVAQLMSTHHVHCIFVMHAGYADAQKPYVWGIVSALDLVQAARRADAPESAGSLAREPMISVKPEMPLTEAAALMLKHQVEHLVVVESDTLRPAGVLATSDVVDVLALG